MLWEKVWIFMLCRVMLTCCIACSVPILRAHYPPPDATQQAG